MEDLLIIWRLEDTVGYIFSRFSISLPNHGGLGALQPKSEAESDYMQLWTK